MADVLIRVPEETARNFVGPRPAHHFDAEKEIQSRIERELEHIDATVPPVLEIAYEVTDNDRLLIFSGNGRVVTFSAGPDKMASNKWELTPSMLEVLKEMLEVPS